MKKTTKGAIAAAAAAVLLAGGAGSMAAWNASTTAGTPQTVTAGSMSVSQTGGAGTWTWSSDGTTFDPGAHKLVPGDKVKYTATYNVNLVGKNLKATLAPTLGGLTGDLVTSNNLSAAAAAGTVTTFTAGENQATTFVTEITFAPKSGTVDNSGMSQTASLAGGIVTLEQTLS